MTPAEFRSKHCPVVMRMTCICDVPSGYHSDACLYDDQWVKDFDTMLAMFRDRYVDAVLTVAHRLEGVPESALDAKCAKAYATAANDCVAAVLSVVSDKESR